MAGSILDILQDEGFFEGFTQFVECLFRVRDGWVDQFNVAAFGKGTSSSFTHFVKEDQHNSFVVFVDFVVHPKIGLHSQKPVHGIIIPSREAFRKSCFDFGWFRH